MVVETLEKLNFSSDAQKATVTILNQVKTRFKEIEKNPIASIATLLDPRFKTSGFSDQVCANRAIAAVKNLLKLCKVTVVDAQTNKQNEINRSIYIIQLPVPHRNVCFLFLGMF